MYDQQSTYPPPACFVLRKLDTEILNGRFSNRLRKIRLFKEAGTQQ